MVKVPEGGLGKGPRWARVTEACDKGSKARQVLRNPYLRILEVAGEQRATLLATDSFVAVSIPVEIDPGDVEGYIPVEAFKEAWKARKGTAAPHIFCGDKACEVSNGPTFPYEDRTEYDFPNIAMLRQPSSAWEPMEEAPLVKDEPFKAGVNAAKLAQGAEALGCAEVIVLARSGSGKPWELRPTTEVDDRFALVMPVRLAGQVLR